MHCPTGKALEGSLDQQVAQLKRELEELRRYINMRERSLTVS